MSNIYPIHGISIHALLAESDSSPNTDIIILDISIHALLAESDRAAMPVSGPRSRFLSTLSLRRATPSAILGIPNQVDFYPRSPCGERPFGHQKQDGVFRISIHALLAESDQ